MILLFKILSQYTYYINTACDAGKVCRMDAQKYVDEEENLDDGAAEREAADNTGSHGNWLQRRRNTAVGPESKQR